MKKKMIKLVEINFEKVKKNKIDLEVELLREAFEDQMISLCELKKEINKVEQMFSKCADAKELIRAISIRDFDDASCNDKYLLYNIENLIC